MNDLILIVFDMKRKIAQAKGRTWDLLVFIYFLSQKQRLTPLGYCAPLQCMLFTQGLLCLPLNSP